MRWSGLFARPALLWEVLRVAWAFRIRGGILPSRALVRWRVATAYGAPEAKMSPDDLVHYLEWRRALRSYRRRNG